MTNRKCGTCRFYEVGAQQTHGWCRNPAYPRRDDVALLRNDELACRSGWGKDFWELRGTRNAIAASPNPLIDETTQPIPVPIGTGIADHQTPTIVATTPQMPAATGVSPRIAARQDGATGAPNAASTPARVLAIAPKDGMMKTSNPPLSHHPELNELGVPIRSPKRSSVAEAHRRAMERRAQERQTKEDRDRLAAQEALKQADADREQQKLAAAAAAAAAAEAMAVTEQRPLLGGLNDFGTPAALNNRGVASGAPKDDRVAPKRAINRIESGIPKRELTRPDIVAPILPRPAAPVAAQDEAIDMIISTDEPPKEITKAPTIATSFAPETIVPAQPERGAQPRFERETETPPEPVQVAEPVNGPLVQEATPVKEPRQAPYWDRSGETRTLGRFGSGSTATPERGRVGQPVREVGRDPKPVSNRPIKPLGAPTINASAVETEREVTMPPVRPPAQVEIKPTIAPPPAAPAPRPIDESLLRQLEQGWQAQQLELHTGQRCGTCRFFQAAEMGRGTCNCPFAPVHRQQTEADGLPCATSLGVWWAAPDEGWLERTERRPRRATPLLDALLREREATEPLRANPPLRRGAR